MTGLILWAYIPSPTVGISLVTIAVFAPPILGIMRVAKSHAHFLKKKKQMAIALVAADESMINDNSDAPLLRDAFDLYDLDKSGDVSLGEVRSLLSDMYPCMPKNVRKEALKVLKEVVGDEDIKFDEFDDVILAWRALASQRDPHGKWHSRSGNDGSDAVKISSVGV